MDVKGPSPQQPSYSSDFKQSVNLFEKSFQDMQHSQLDAQRAQYEKVMREALHTMQEAAMGMLNQQLVQMKDKLSNDLENYLDQPTDANKKKVEGDLNKLKKNN